MSSVFVSYPRASKDQVATLARHLDAKKIEHFWDHKLGAGDWEAQLNHQLDVADAIIIVITDDVCNRGDQSYVFTEVKQALDLGYDMVLPILVGNLNLPEALGAMLSRFQMLRVDSFASLFLEPKLSDLLRYLDDIAKYIADGGRKSATYVSSAALQSDACGWPESGEHLVELQSLALALAMLEGEPASLVVDAARSIESKMQSIIRDETEEELNAKARGLTWPSLSTLMDTLGAERVLVSSGKNARQEVLRFRDPNRRRDLLTYLWREHPTVRDFLLSWFDDLYDDSASVRFAQYISGGLAHLAQIDLITLQHRLLSQWLRPQFQLEKLQTTSDLLASAYNVSSNRDEVRRIVFTLAAGKDLHPSMRPVAREAALVIALDALGHRAPEIAVDLFKELSEEFRKGPRWNRRLLERVELSPLMAGHIPDSDSQSDVDVFGGADAGPVSEVSNAAGASASGVAHSPVGPASTVAQSTETEASTDAQSPEEVQSEQTDMSEGFGDGGREGALPVTDFLGSLAVWIDEKISARSDRGVQKRALLDRQVALWVFLTVFRRLPLYDDPDVNQVSLQTLMFDIMERQPSLKVQIYNAFVRAVVAKMQIGSTYIARNHFQNVMKAFAYERKNAPAPEAPERDPYLILARDLHRLIEARKPGYGDFVFKGSGRLITNDDRDFICGPAHVD